MLMVAMADVGEIAFAATAATEGEGATPLPEEEEMGVTEVTANREEEVMAVMGATVLLETAREGLEVMALKDMETMGKMDTQDKRNGNMKILRILLGTSLIFPIALVAYTDKHLKHRQNYCRIYNGKNGEDGKDGENGQNGEDGGFFGGNGGKGGSGGKEDNGAASGGDGGNGGNSTNATSEQVDELEYKILKDVCHLIIAKIEECLTWNRSINDTVAQQLFKTELLKYLLSQETSASRKICEEYEAVNWEYPAIKKV